MDGRSLSETPTWTVATVTSLLVGTGFLIHGGLKKFGKWLDRTKRKHLLAALNKITEELMVFGVLSLLMGHWLIFVPKICVKSSALSSRFYPCAPHYNLDRQAFVNHALDTRPNNTSFSIPRRLLDDLHKDFCPEDHQPFASHESLEQLHRLLFVLVVMHVSYSFLAVALAMIKIYSWRAWENHAKTMAFRGLLRADGSNDSQNCASNGAQINRPSSFIYHRASHRWSQHSVLVWLLCFSRQFWSSINQTDYTALRLGFVTTHQLPLTYDFHNYMLRSMEEEFRDIVGISVPLWIFAISCIILGFHGTNIYFWVSFIPVILILLIGTKLHHIVVKLAVEIMDSSQRTGSFDRFNLRDELFWFGKPRLLLFLIQFVSFQNAFEMATFVWSLWEIRGASCFTGSQIFLIIRLTFGIVSQFWCSFVTFPLYVIVTQMGSKYKKTIVSENVRRSLHGWRKRVRAKQESTSRGLKGTASTTSLDSMVDGEEVNRDDNTSTCCEDHMESDQNLPMERLGPDERLSQHNQTLRELLMSSPLHEDYD
ncbi:MLO-like protein 4 [Henckelia pumila]|uniref:MLO-like protein 4 n=1 Tax=Henckelia pumila TaxID=405737 RepID=UPI003C6E7A39